MHPTCRLEKPTLSYEEAVTAMVASWRNEGGRMNPGLLRQLDNDYPDWLRYLARWEAGIGTGDAVPQTLYLLKRGDGAVLGAVSIRHYLNHTNRTDGGHIGYGICPAFRGKGYGSRILALALGLLSQMGIEDVLVTCAADNLLSQKVIVRNGGVLENQMRDEDGGIVNRYWIRNK